MVYIDPKTECCKDVQISTREESNHGKSIVTLGNSYSNFEINNFDRWSTQALHLSATSKTCWFRS